MFIRYVGRPLLLRKKNFTTTIYLYRYIDDIIFSANHSNCLFPVKYASYLNLIKNILTDDYSINFLDLKVILNNQQLCSDIFV